MPRADRPGFTPARLVVFRPGAIGDMAVAAPLLFGLQSRFPDTAIDYLSERHGDARTATSDEVAAMLPCVTRTHLYATGETWLDRLRSIRSMLRPNRNDLLAYLCYQRGSPLTVLRDLLFFRLAGFRRFTGARAALLDALRAGIAPRRESETDRLFRLLAADGLVIPRRERYALTIDRTFAERFWTEHGLGDTTVIAVCPSAKMQAKLWPVVCYADALNRIAAQHDAVFVFVGGHDDAENVAAIRRLCSARSVSALGCTLPQSAAILARCGLYLGNDTGPMHLAAVQGTPCVALFSARDREGRWRPYGAQHRILRAEVPCAGCMQARCYADPAVCMARISVAAVVEAVNHTLTERSGACLH